MYIKEVAIKCFKSYNGKHIISDLVPGQNVIVGKNGSGKSNIFQALEFVLTDNIRYLRQHEKYTLYYGGRQTSAYVEVVLADCDPLLRFDRNELRIRRVIINNGDSFYINKKRTNHKQVKALLEICGFAYPKPFFIISQKMINSMLLQPEKKMLEYLIRSLNAGMSENIISLNEIINRLEDIKSRADNFEDAISCNIDNHEQIEEERLNHSKFRKLNSLKTTLLVIITERNLLKLKKKKDEIKKLISKAGESKLNVLNNNIFKLECSLKEISEKLELYEHLKQDILYEMEQTLKKKEKMSLSTTYLRKNIDLLKDVHEDKSSETEDLDLSGLDSKISNLLVEMAEVQEALCSRKEILELNEEILASKEQRHADIISIAAKMDSFTSKAIRDAWLNKKISSINSQIKALKAKYESLSKSVAPLKELLLTYESNLKKIDDDPINDLKLIQEEKEIKSKNLKLQEDLNDLQRRESTTVHEIELLKKTVCEKKILLRKKLGNGILKGNESVKIVLEQWKMREGRYEELIAGYYGMVIDCFQCDESLNVAVDVAAGKKLYSHIVSNEIIGTEILKDIGRNNLPGEVWFMPLNRLQVYVPELPHHVGAVPLISKLQFQEEIGTAIQFIFGKILICRKYEIAIELAKASNITCVTLDGDKVSGKGIITGGYINHQLAYRTTHKELNEFEAKLWSLSSEYDVLTSKIACLQNEINKNVSSLHKIKSQRNFNAQQIERRLLQEKLNDIKKEIENYNTKSQEVVHSLKKLYSSKEGLQVELNKVFVMQRPELLEELGHLNKDIKLYKQKLVKSRTKLTILEHKVHNLEIMYERTQRLREIKSNEIEELKICKVKHKSNLKELLILEKRIQTLTNDLGVLEQNIVEAKEKDNEFKVQLKKLRDEQDEETRSLMLGKRDYYEGKLEIYNNRIKECEFTLKKSQTVGKTVSDKFKLYSVHQLRNKLAEVEADLKRCGNVNQKVDWFGSEAIKLLKAVKNTVDEFFIGFDMIMQYEDWLRQYVNYSLEQISLNFGTIVNQMLPGKSARLQLMKQETELLRGCSVDGLFGASIQVQSGSDQTFHSINALSGGEKVIIFLCLVFSYSQLHTTYILDEIDRALDKDHKMQIGGLLGKLKNQVQFITSSHSKEFILSGERFIATSFKNMSSHIQLVSRNQAEEVITGIENSSIRDSNGSSTM